MHYLGAMLPKFRDKELTKRVYKFLQEALSEVPEDSPFRGPRSFSGKEFLYINGFEGDISAFFGDEAIRFNTGDPLTSEIVHQVMYCGALTKLLEESKALLGDRL